MNKKVYYFSHDNNAHQDAKIKAMISVYGAEGYGWYWILIELMMQQESYKISIQKKYDIASIASSLPNCSVDKCKDFIDDCIHEFDLFLTDNVSFWSASLLKRMGKLEDTIEKRRKAANVRWGKTKEQPQDYIAEKKPETIFEEVKEEVEVKEVIPSKVKNIDVLQNKEYFNLFINELRQGDDFKNLTDKFLNQEREKAIDWIKANGKVKKDYRAFFRTWIRNNYDSPTPSLSNQNKPRTMHL